MSKSLFLLLVLATCLFCAKAQVIVGTQNFIQPSGSLNAIDQNQQQFNPAASSLQEQKGYRFCASAPMQIANLGAGYIGCFYPQNRCALYHELSGVFHPAGQYLQTAHALAFTPLPDLKIGLGLQVELYTQPQFYGSLLVASARLGCQYALKKHQQIALVLQNIGRVAQQQINIEHVLALDERLSFAQGFSWNPQYKPNLYLTLSQRINKAKFQFTCGLFPQYYAFSIVLYKDKNFDWLLGQRWHSRQGLWFQIGLNLH